MDRDKYIKDLEETLQKFLAPLANIPYPIAIRAITGRTVIPFDINVPKARNLLEQLIHAAQEAGSRAFELGIFTDRPNEVGNRIEAFVLEALVNTGLNAAKPKTRSGRIKVAGYPDIVVSDAQGQTCYIDCKTYNVKTKETTFRSFYFSPSEEPKITEDGYHLLMSFEIDKATRGGRSAFVPISWQLYTLDKLLVDVKHEFNANNRDLYRPEALLAQGRIGGR